MPSAFWRGKGRSRKVYIKWKIARGEWSRPIVTAYATLGEGREEARKREVEAQEARAGRKRPLKKDMPLRQAVYQEYLPSLPPGYASKNSLEGRFRNRILERAVDGARKYGDLMCREGDAGHIRRVLALNDDCSPATREQLRVAIQGLYTFLIGAKRADENPAANVPKVRVPKRKPRFLMPDQIPLLLQAWPENRRLNFCFNVATGARKDQAFNLKWPDVHEDLGYCVLFGKDNEENVVPLPDWLCLLLMAERAIATSEYVFPKPEGLKGAGGRQPKWVAMHRIMKTALRRAGLVDGYDFRCVTRGELRGCNHKGRRPQKGTLECPGCHQNTLEVVGRPIHITFHNLRSTFATWAYAHTRDIRFVQLCLGHSDTRTTERYAAAIDEHMRILANRVQLNPFATPALPAHAGTPVGHGKDNGVPRGAMQGSAPTQDNSERTSDASR